MTLTARPGQPLTAVEVEALQYAAEGHTAEQTARRLRISRAAVLDRTAAARTKLQARSTTHAVVLAYRTGQLDLDGQPAQLVQVRALVEQLHAVTDPSRSAA
ncbi:LuxR C-terminal-related transcriptional regulator [Kitasatospora purpeofusca]|uniref:LuxR C-terminal-related transcriptional regulator n=1 Tax=Kitasatospora purpeofusca TaxID=67352 RepID=UPI0035DC4665